MKPDRESNVWTVEVLLEEDGDETDAKALLRVGDRELGGWGHARRNPHDPDRPRVGEELAVARRSRSCHTSFSTPPREIEEFEGRRVRLHG